MRGIELKKHIYWVGVNNPELRVFDIIMETKKGTTYNSYLIDDEKIAIVDTVKNGYYDEFIANIKEIIGEKKVDYIIVQHTELDHSGSLNLLLEDYPEAKIVASKAAIRYLGGILNREFHSIPAEGDLVLGNKTLKFISAPNLHWPDTIFTYIKEDSILFTCDVMGCHYAPKGCITEQCVEDYEKEMKYYYDVIMSPFKKFVNMALDKIENLEKSMIAPSHGPVHIEKIDYYTNLYRQWSKDNLSEEKNIQIFYVSAYGNTEKMGEYLKEKITERGIKAEINEITSKSLDELITLVDKSSGILIGSPTINQDAVEPAWNLLSHTSAIVNRGKAAGAFGSYGWSGEGVNMLTSRLKDLKLKVVNEGLKFNFVPSDSDFKEADKFIDKFIEIL